MPRATETADRIDTEALLKIQDLEWRARVVVEGFLSGLHKSPYHGFSVEFTEYRQYTPGDDPRYIDWKLYARSDRAYVKKYEDETNLRVHIILDKSASMNFGSLNYTKADYAISAAATLAYFLMGQRDAVGLTTFDTATLEFVPARYRPRRLRELLIAMEKPARNPGTNIEAPLRQAAERLRQRGVVVLISDFISDLESWIPHLNTLAAYGHEILLFQVVDPAEESLDLGSPAVFVDAETKQRVYIDPDAAKKEYTKKFNEAQDRLKAACQRIGAHLSVARTDAPLERLLGEWVNQRNEFSPKRRNFSKGRGA